MEAWREGLERLREMEDEVGNVMRDREILYVSSLTVVWFVLYILIGSICCSVF